MIRLIGEAREALSGVAMMMAFRPGWRAKFDVSAAGVARSFLAALVSLPAFALIVAGANFLVASDPEIALRDPDAGFTLAEAAIHYVRLWIVFPLVAALTVQLVGAKAAFGPWLVVHNWTVCALLMFQGALWALYVAGMADEASLSAVLAVYAGLRLIAHWRVAAGALGLGWGPAAMAAALPVMADYVALMALARVI